MKSEDDSAISKSSESAIAHKNKGSESSSDTEDDASKDINEDDEEEEVDEKHASAPVPMARKVSVPADTTEDFSREEYELSKRETVNVEDATRKVSAVQINEDSDSEPEEDNKKMRTYSSSDGEDEVPVKTVDERRISAARSSSSSEEADDGHCSFYVHLTSTARARTFARGHTKTEIDFPDEVGDRDAWEWKFKHGLADKIDYLIAHDPDKFGTDDNARPQWEEWLSVRKKSLNIVKEKSTLESSLFTAGNEE